MIESFVDLTYRGLSLGRRVKLTQVRPSTGYLEHPTPMPVGTPLAITADEGVTFEVVVMDVHEQVGGSERAPGMTVKPTLADDKRVSWWNARVTLPELELPKRPERIRSVTVRPRSHPVPSASASDAGVAANDAPAMIPAAPILPIEHDVEAEQIVDEKKTAIMDAVDQELLEELTRTPNEVEQLVRHTGEHAIVDDGQRTTIMDAVDPSTLGLEVTASGTLVAISDDGTEDDDEPAQPGNGNGNGTKLKKRRKKKR